MPLKTWFLPFLLLTCPAVAWAQDDAQPLRSEWKPVNGAAYYVGEIAEGGHKVRVRTNEPWLVYQKGHLDNVVGYAANGHGLGRVKFVEKAAPPTEPKQPEVKPPARELKKPEPAAAKKPEPVKEPESVVEPTKEPEPAAEPTKEPEPVKEPAPEAKQPEPAPAAAVDNSPSRPVRLELAGSLGKETLNSKGGYSEFDGSPVVGGGALQIDWLRAPGSGNRWEFGVALDYRKFSFDSHEEVQVDASEDRVVKERLSLFRFAPSAHWTAADLGAGAGVAFGTSLMVNQVPTLKVVDVSRGETRLKEQTAFAPSLDAIYDAPNLTAGLKLGAKSVTSDVKKWSAAEVFVQGRLGLGSSGLTLDPGVTYRTETYEVAIKCPDVVNTTSTCRNPALSTDKLLMVLVGLGKVL